MGYSQSADQVERNVKTCRNCKIEKHLSEFYFSTSKGYYGSQCMECWRNRPMRSLERPEYDGVSTKVCSKCKETKPLTEFAYVKRDARFYSYCNPCKREMRREISRDQHLKRTYGITEEEFNELLIAQGSKCLICEVEFDKAKTNVDHNKITGMIRSILCNTCNVVLGIYKEDTKRLRACGYTKHAEYLEKFI